MMGTLVGSNEIVELPEDSDSTSNICNDIEKNNDKPWNKYSIEDDINKLFEAIDIRKAHRACGQPERVARDTSSKSAMKRPMKAGPSQVSGIGISESVSLKQALRGLCISQASEMAAMRKRLLKSSPQSRVSEAGAIKRLYRAVVIESNESGHPLNDGKQNVVEISLVPERSSNVSDVAPESGVASNLEKSNQCCMLPSDGPTQKADVSSVLANQCADVGCQHSKPDMENFKKLPHSSTGHTTNRELLTVGEIVDPAHEVSIKSEKKQEGNMVSASASSVLTSSGRFKSVGKGLYFNKPGLRSQAKDKKKIVAKTKSTLSSSVNSESTVDNDLGCENPQPACQKPISQLKNEERKMSPTSSGNSNMEVCSSDVKISTRNHVLASNGGGKAKSLPTRAYERSVSKEKGEISQSSKSSIGEFSSTASYSDESYISGSSCSGRRPHMSKDLRWEAVHSVQKQHGHLGLRHFKLLKKLGGGDIGTVYLSELIGTHCLFAVKVMDNDSLSSRKFVRAQTEKEIMGMLDHPFLPTLYAHFTTDKFSCLVMEYCPGGDMHVLRQKQPNKVFSEQAARFYVAEVLLALEYLHMLGVVYRDLKPENILVREDGHIMLTDFDLSLRCAVNPTILVSPSLDAESPKKMSGPCSDSSCIEPFCLHPSWQVSCFTPSFLSTAAKTRKIKSELAAQVSPLPQLVVEPTTARSNSFVGTHEYLAPEIVKGDGHGSSVDWWTFGIFLYELLYGKTPFKGTGTEDTLANVVSQCLKFPETPMVSSNARDLMRRLLRKEPENRLGFAKGAVEIKEHSFFEGLNWALIRCATPPQLPRFFDLGNLIADTASQDEDSTCDKYTGGDVDFEMF